MPSLLPRAPVRERAGWFWAAIFGVTVLAYLPTLSAGFIWDDSGHVTRPDLRSLHGSLRIWTELGATQQYYPLLHTAFWLEHRLWGDAALGYHAINVLLHATVACLFGTALRRLRVPGAWMAALLFALHPVAVESVAWISEQKNTLSAVFYLSGALAYLRFDERRDCPDIQVRRSAIRSYWLGTLLFILALLCKTVTATLPAALLVVLWWKRGRLSWKRDGAALLPWIGVGVAAGELTSWVERTLIGAQGAGFDLNGLQRGLLAGRVIWFYLGKLFWPANLIFIYPRWTVDRANPWSYAFPLAVLLLLAAAVAVSRRYGRRGPLAALLFFIGSLFPALGFVNVYPFIFSFVADHFQYLASLGIFALVAAGLAAIFRHVSVWRGRTLSVLLLGTLGALTWRQSRTYHDLLTLYQTTIDRNPSCWMAEDNLGSALVGAGRGSEAISHFERSLQLKPDYPEAENNLGDALNQLNRAPEAVPHLEHAVRLMPGFAQAHNNLGVSFMLTGRTAEGTAEFEQAVRLKADYPAAQCNLGLALASHGLPGEALTHFEQAIRLQPDYPEAELDWAMALTELGRQDEATVHYERARRLNAADIQPRR